MENQNKSIADFLLNDFEQEVQTTLRVLAAVPSGNLDYQPDAKSKTALGLMRHLVVDDAWLFNSIADGVFAPPPAEDSCGVMNPADAVAQYQANVPAAMARVRAMSAEQLGAILDLFGMVQAPAVTFVSMAVKHSIHHRGQLSTYIRPMGGKIPGIYGPSGDTQ